MNMYGITGQPAGMNFFQNAGQQQNQLRSLIQNSGSENLKKIANEMSDDQLTQYVMQHPDELQGDNGLGTPWGDSAQNVSQAGPNGATSQSNATGNAQATGAAAVGSDQADISSDSDSGGDCYDENDEIPKDEAMASGQMCGMSDVSGADKCKPHTQQCLGEAKAIKKVLETIQKADQDNSTIGGDIKEVDTIVEDLHQKLKKGKKAADGAFSNPQDAAACGKEVDEKVKKAMEIAENNGVQIELSEKRNDQLSGGGGGGQQGAGGAKAAPQAAQTKQAPQAGQAKQAAQPQQAQQNEQAKQQNDAQNTTQANNKANQANDAGGGGQDDQKPFKIISQPKQVDKELSLDDVQNNPQLAQALEASLDETLAQMDAKQGGEAANMGQTIDLGATRQGSPMAQGLDMVGKPGAGKGDGSVFGQAATQGFAGGMPGGGKGGFGGGAGGFGGVGGHGAVNTTGLANKMKKAGLDTNKKFNVKAEVYEPGMAVQIQRDGDPSPVKVGKDMGDASMKVKPPPLAAIDQNGQIHRIGDIHATDAGKSGMFSAKIKEGQPIMNLPAAVNTVQGDVALPGTKTEDQNKDQTAQQAQDVQKAAT
jgi:hypothetical protein